MFLVWLYRYTSLVPDSATAWWSLDVVGQWELSVLTDQKIMSSKPSLMSSHELKALSQQLLCCINGK